MASIPPEPHQISGLLPTSYRPLLGTRVRHCQLFLNFSRVQHSQVETPLIVSVVVDSHIGNQLATPGGLGARHKKTVDILIRDIRFSIRLQSKRAQCVEDEAISGVGNPVDGCLHAVGDVEIAGMQ